MLRLSLWAVIALIASITLLPAASASPPPGSTFLSTLAGTGERATSPDGGPAKLAALRDPVDIAWMPDGSLLVVEEGANKIRRIAPDGTISTAAGNGTNGFSGDGGPATEAQLSIPVAISVAPDASFLIADQVNNRIRRVAPNGTITTVAGSGTTWGFGGDGGPATSALLFFPSGVAATTDGGFLISDMGNQRIRRVDAGGIITTVAGSGVRGFGGDSGSATAAKLDSPGAVKVIPAGGYQFTDYANRRVRRVSGGVITTVAGTGVAGFSGDGGPATAADMQPGHTFPLSDGSFLISDQLNNRIRRVDPAGTITTIAGTGAAEFKGDGGPALQASFFNPSALAVSSHGITVADLWNMRVRLIDRTSIVSAPPAISPSANASFDIATLDVGVAIECRRDDLAWASCPDDKSFSGLAEGLHSFEARSADLLGAFDPTPAQYSWVVDTTPPNPFALNLPTAGATVATLAPTFSWAIATDATTAVDHYELAVDGAVRQVPTTRCAAGECVEQHAGALADGGHNWSVAAVDEAGNRRTTAERGFTVAVPPHAALRAATNLVLTDAPVTLDAGASHDTNGSIVAYDWDFQGDGVFDSRTTIPTAAARYASPGSYAARVRVIDGGGLTAEAAAVINVAPAPPAGPVGVSVNDAAIATNLRDVRISLVWPSFATHAVVSNDGGFRQAQTFALAPSIPWTLVSSGPERLPKTIYVRFRGFGTNELLTFTDDIILDETQPTVQSATVSRGYSLAALDARGRRIVHVRARDNAAGITAMQVTDARRRVRKIFRTRRARQLKSKVNVLGFRPRYVRVRDAARNWSSWRIIRQSK